MNGARLHIEPTWQAPPGVRALTTLRRAGSFGPTDEGRNERLLALAQLPSAPVWLRQVHGIEVADLDVPQAQPLPVADAAVVTCAGVVCAIQTADCLPVLLASVDGSVVAAAHAGWRGLAAGVVEATVERMRARLPAGTGIVAWLGPAISATRFEVGGEVREAFLRSGPGADAAFLPNTRGRWQCDLYQLARDRLGRLGIEDVSGGEHCTYEEVSRFHSHRRDSATAGAATGRMVSLLWRELR